MARESETDLSCFSEILNVRSRTVFLGFDCMEGSAERPHLPSFLSLILFSCVHCSIVLERVNLHLTLRKILH